MNADCIIVFEGKKIRGEAKAIGYLDSVEVTSWSWGASHSNRGLAPGKAGRPDIRDFVFSHKIDAATPVLMLYCTQANPIPSATMTMFSQGGRGNPEKYVEIKFLNVRVTSVELSYTPERLLPEQVVTLSFTQADFSYIPQTDTGKADTSRGIPSFNWISEALNDRGLA